MGVVYHKSIQEKFAACCGKWEVLLELAAMVVCCTQARTYPDLLKSPHDGALLEYYGQSDLVYVKVWPLESHSSHPSTEHGHL
jgi:hypothetical protein